MKLRFHIHKWGGFGWPKKARFERMCIRCHTWQYLKFNMAIGEAKWVSLTYENTFVYKEVTHGALID